MGIKACIKALTPSPIWEYLRRKKAERKMLSLAKYCIKTYRKSPEKAGGFIVLDSWEERLRFTEAFSGEKYYSQACQDCFLDRFIFSGKEGGFFLDIGGNDPVNINNTYFFEKNRGWSGLAFEPMLEQREKWKTSRITECLPYALGEKDGEAEFCEYEDHYMSGFSDEVNYGGKVKARWKVPVRRLAGILEERGIKHIDFVSLDVEGAEVEVLKGIDFSRVGIDCFTIENDKGASRERGIRDFMIEAGYRIKAKLWLDEIWIKDRITQ